MTVGQRVVELDRDGPVLLADDDAVQVARRVREVDGVITPDLAGRQFRVEPEARLDEVDFVVIERGRRGDGRGDGDVARGLPEVKTAQRCGEFGQAARRLGEGPQKPRCQCGDAERGTRLQERSPVGHGFPLKNIMFCERRSVQPSSRSIAAAGSAVRPRAARPSMRRRAIACEIGSPRSLMSIRTSSLSAVCDRSMPRENRDFEYFDTFFLYLSP